MLSPRVRVQRLRLDNVRCFDELDIEFGRDGQATDWTVLLGNNGAGKSTLLRALALALAPSQDVGPMVHADGESWVGPHGSIGRISIEVLVGDQRHEHKLELDGRGRSTDIARESRWDSDSILLAGYGAARQLQGTKEFTRYSPYDSTATLMSTHGSLQNPELALRRAASNDAETKELLARIDRILLLEPGSTQLGKLGLMVRQDDGILRPLTQLSDGYRGTLSWVLDLIGWQLMATEYASGQELPAIVLVDEVEQHLHPQWQRSVIARLREQFPTVQFIVSTHAPLCVLGSTELDDDDISLAYIERGVDGEGKTYSRVTSGIRPPRGQRADQVLNSYLFGLTSSRDEQTERDIQELSALLSTAERSPDQQARIEALREDLEPLLGSAETPLEREVQRASLAAAERVIEQRVAQLSKEEAQRLLALEELAP